MPSVELSKLQVIAATRAVSTSDRAQIAAPAAPRSDAAAPGVSVEVNRAGDVTTAPVDAERVAQIRAALRYGSYPLVPTQIADAMIAAQVSFTLPAKD
jgi:negative regulator of flagellin synthesis FlgM